MKMLGTALVLAVVFAPWLTAESVGADEEKKKDIEVRLSISTKEYDPKTPSKATVECVVANKSGEPVEVELGYGGLGNRLKARSGSGLRRTWELTLHKRAPRKQVRPPKFEKVKIKPGEEQVVFKLPLDDILLNGSAALNEASEGRSIWRWDWPARPSPPFTPIHGRHVGIHSDQAAFWADVHIDGKSHASSAVVLKVRSDDKADE